MDGSHSFLPRLPRALVALATLAGALALGSGVATGDDAVDPSVRWPVAGPAIRTALTIAEEHWGAVPCQGAVALAWEDLDPSIDAQAMWANDAGQYADPIRNTECQLSFNPRGQWDWPKLCTIMVHEVGHLDGHEHVDDPADVMYYTYMGPLPACADTPEPGSGALAPATATTPTAPAPPAKAQPASRRSQATAAAAGRRRAAAKRRTAARRASARHRPTRRSRRSARRS